MRVPDTQLFFKECFFYIFRWALKITFNGIPHRLVLFLSCFWGRNYLLSFIYDLVGIMCLWKCLFDVFGRIFFLFTDSVVQPQWLFAINNKRETSSHTAFVMMTIMHNGLNIKEISVFSFSITLPPPSSQIMFAFYMHDM